MQVIVVYVATDGALFPQSEGSLLRGREQENIQKKKAEMQTC